MNPGTRRAWYATAALGIYVVTLGSCRPLSVIEGEECGNGILEERDEDCEIIADGGTVMLASDVSKVDGLQCGPREGAVAQRCRFLCGQSNVVCPERWGCASGVCVRLSFAGASPEMLTTEEGSAVSGASIEVASAEGVPFVAFLGANYALSKRSYVLVSSSRTSVLRPLADGVSALAEAHDPKTGPSVADDFTLVRAPSLLTSVQSGRLTSKQMGITRPYPEGEFFATKFVPVDWPRVGDSASATLLAEGFGVSSGEDGNFKGVIRIDASSGAASAEVGSVAIAMADGSLPQQSVAIRQPDGKCFALAVRHSGRVEMHGCLPSVAALTRNGTPWAFDMPTPSVFLAAGDTDGDGYDELLAAGLDGPVILDVRGSSRQWSLLSGTIKGTLVFAEDIDRDGIVDVAANDDTTSRATLWHKKTKAAVLWEPWLTSERWASATAGDFTADGARDLAVVLVPEVGPGPPGDGGAERSKTRIAIFAAKDGAWLSPTAFLFSKVQQVLAGRFGRRGKDVLAVTESVIVASGPTTHLWLFEAGADGVPARTEFAVDLKAPFAVLARSRSHGLVGEPLAEEDLLAFTLAKGADVQFVRFRSDGQARAEWTLGCDNNKPFADPTALFSSATHYLAANARGYVAAQYGDAAPRCETATGAGAAVAAAVWGEWQGPTLGGWALMTHDGNVSILRNGQLTESFSSGAVSGKAADRGPLRPLVIAGSPNVVTLGPADKGQAGFEIFLLWNKASNLGTFARIPLVEGLAKPSPFAVRLRRDRLTNLGPCIELVWAIDVDGDGGQSGQRLQIQAYCADKESPDETSNWNKVEPDVKVSVSSQYERILSLAFADLDQDGFFELLVSTANRSFMVRAASAAVRR